MGQIWPEHSNALKTREIPLCVKFGPPLNWGGWNQPKDLKYKNRTNAALILSLPIHTFSLSPT